MARSGYASKGQDRRSEDGCRQIVGPRAEDVWTDRQALRSAQSFALPVARSLLEAAGRAPPTGDLPVLDVCTGTGDLALLYRRAAAADVPVVAADFCHEMLVYGTQKDSAEAPLQWVETDAETLPFPDASFQLVSVAFGLRNVADTDRGLGEMARVCAPGGQIVILEFSLPTRQPLALLYGAYFRYVLPRFGQLLARNRESAYNYLPQSVGEFPQGERLAEKMRAAGLCEVRWIPMTFGVVTLYLAKRKTQ